MQKQQHFGLPKQQRQQNRETRLLMHLDHIRPPPSDHQNHVNQPAHWLILSSRKRDRKRRAYHHRPGYGGTEALHDQGNRSGRFAGEIFARRENNKRLFQVRTAT
jgi:hypothetical protein